MRWTSSWRWFLCKGVTMSPWIFSICVLWTFVDYLCPFTIYNMDFCSDQSRWEAVLALKERFKSEVMSSIDLAIPILFKLSVEILNIISVSKKVIYSFRFRCKYSLQESPGPLKMSAYKRPPKGLILAQTRVVWAVMRVDAILRSASICMEETRKKVKKTWHFTYAWGATIQAIAMTFGV